MLKQVVFYRNRDSLLIQTSCREMGPAWMTRPYSEDVRERALANPKMPDAVLAGMYQLKRIVLLDISDCIQWYELDLELLLAFVDFEGRAHACAASYCAPGRSDLDLMRLGSIASIERPAVQ
jgi:hypothetical protein